MQVRAPEASRMDTVPMETLGPVKTLDLIRHVNVGCLAGRVGEPAVVDSVKIDVV